MCKQRCAEDERARIVICRMKTVNENEKKGGNSVCLPMCKKT